MKNLVVFYSWTGSTRVAARELARIMGAELIEIEEKKPRKSFMGSAFAAIMNMKSPIKPLSISAQEYDNILIGTPVWASRLAPAINTFLSTVDLRGKNVYLFVTQADNKLPEALTTAFNDKASRYGARPQGSVSFQTVMKKELLPEAVAPAAEAWLKKCGLAQ